MTQAVAGVLLFGYFLVGVTFGGLMTRRFNDDSMLPAFLVGWPIALPIVFLIFIYCVAAGKEFR